MYRITVVEDDHLLQDSVKKILESQGSRCASAPMGHGVVGHPRRQAGSGPSRREPSRHDRHDICRALKADPRTAAVPVIILTGEARDAASQVAGLEAGAEDYIFKPVDWRVLASRVKSILAAVSRGKA